MVASREEIFDKIKSILIEKFDLDGDRITPEARLYDDLDIDSIDVVDLIVEMKNIIGKKVIPESFKNIRTIGDVSDAIFKIVNE